MFDRNQQAEMAYTPDSGEQQGEIYNAIVEISQATLVDARLILAVIMQEVRLYLLSSRCIDTNFSPLI